MLDKSKDYLYQNSTLTVWYLPKVVDGDVVFNTNSIAVFKGAAGTRPIEYALRNMPERKGELQVDRASFNLWREPCGDLVPAIGDKLFDGEWFWLVDEVEFCDRDDLHTYNRYRLHCTKSKQRVIA